MRSRPHRSSTGIDPALFCAAIRTPPLLLIAALFLASAILLLPFPGMAAPPDCPLIQDIKARIRLSEAEREWLAAHHEVRVRVGQWPPFMMTGETPEGISIDYLRVIGQTLGIDITFLTPADMSWSDSLKRIGTGDGVDLLPAIQPSPDRMPDMRFTEPYQELPWVIVTRDDAPFVGDMNDLEGKTVSVQKNFTLQAKLKRRYPALDLIEVDTPEPTLDSLRLVATGKAFATVNALPIVVFFIRQQGLTNLRVAAPAGFEDMRLAMAIRPDWPELASIINKTFDAMTRADRTAIQDAWLSIHYEYGVSRKTVLFGILGIVGAALVLFGLLHAINRALKRQVRDRTRELQNELAERERAESALRDSESRFRAIAEHLPMPMLQTRPDGTIEYVNNRLIEFIGVGREHLPSLNELWALATPDQDSAGEAKHAFEAAGPPQGGDANIPAPFLISLTDRTGSRREMEIFRAPFSRGEVMIFLDATERNRIRDALLDSVDAKNTLIKEIHHRTKNNLQIISGLLTLQEEFSEGPPTQGILEECRQRIQSMALIHEKLYQSRDMSDIRLDEYVRSFMERFARSMEVKGVKFDIRTEEVLLTIDQAVPCGLIINELATNALKHAFTADKDNRIFISVAKSGNRAMLTVSDNGRGLSKDVDLDAPQSLGLTLVTNLAVQLGGDLSFATGNGLSVTLSFPL